MYNLNYYEVLFLITLATIVLCVKANDLNSRDRREISEDCRFLITPRRGRSSHGETGPHRPPPFCCELPNIVSFSPEDFAKCNDVIHPTNSAFRRSYNRRRSTNHSEVGQREKRSDEKDISHDDNGVPPPPVSQDKKECVLNCLFNVTGLLSQDNTLNEETLNLKLLEEVSNNTKWAPNIDNIFRKCVAAAKEANSQSQKNCKPGAAEYMKCMLRELFFNCPSDLWNNSSECSEFKNKLEKCPNLHPPPHLHPMPHRPRRGNVNY